MYEPQNLAEFKCITLKALISHLSRTEEDCPQFAIESHAEDLMDYMVNLIIFGYTNPHHELEPSDLDFGRKILAIIDEYIAAHSFREHLWQLA